MFMARVCIFALSIESFLLTVFWNDHFAWFCFQRQGSFYWLRWLQHDVLICLHSVAHFSLNMAAYLMFSTAWMNEWMNEKRERLIVNMSTVTHSELPTAGSSVATNDQPEMNRKCWNSVPADVPPKSQTFSWSSPRSEKWEEGSESLMW